MDDQARHVEELKAALAEAVETIKTGAALGPVVVKKRLDRYQFLAFSQAPLVEAREHKLTALRRYVSQLEGLARRVIGDGGARAQEARMIFMKENLRAIGLVDDKVVSGVFNIEKLKDDAQHGLPTLDKLCPSRNGGHHETYLDRDGKRLYCRSCGAEGTWGGAAVDEKKRA